VSSAAATAVFAATGAARPWLFGPAAAAGITASAAARNRLVAGLGGATSWAAVGLVWAALLAIVALVAPGACIDPVTGADVACSAQEVLSWAAVGPIVTIAVLLAGIGARLVARVARRGARTGTAAARHVRAGAGSPWVLRGVEMLGGAFAAAAVAAVAGGSGGVVLTAAAAGAAVSPIVAPFGGRDRDDRR
jgi:hypothetical protein